MFALEVKGKSTTHKLRGAFVLIDHQTADAIQKLLQLSPSTSPASEYIFARYITTYNFRVSGDL